MDKALSNLYGVLTENNIQENLKVGQEKYDKGVPQLSNQKVSQSSVYFFFI